MTVSRRFHDTAREEGHDIRARSGWQSNGPLLSLITRQTWHLQSGAIALGLAIPALAVWPLSLQERMIDEALPAADADLALWLGGLYLGAVLLRSALKFGVIYLRGIISAVIARGLRSALIDAQRRRRSPEARTALGAVTSVLTAEAQPLGDFASEAINTPLIQGGTLIGVFGYMVTADARLAAIGIASLAAEAIITPILQSRINRLTAKRIATLRSAGSHIIEAADHDGDGEVIESLHEIRRTYQIRLRMVVLKAALKVSRNLIDHLADVALLTFGTVLVMRGEAQIGVVVAFLSGLRMIRAPWGELVSYYRRLADAAVKYDLVRAAITPRPVAAGPSAPL